MRLAQRKKQQVIYRLEDLENRRRSIWIISALLLLTLGVGFCVMLFCLISAPCMATIVITKHESGSWRWAALQLGGLTALAYIVTLIVYQVGSLFE